MSNYIYLAGLFFLFSSCKKVNKSCKGTYPAIIVQSSLQKEYDFAKKELYRLNVLEGDSSFRWIPSNREKPLTEKILSSLQLEFNDIQYNQDTLTLFFMFEDGLAPSEHPYYNNISLWKDSTVYGVNYFENGGFLQEKNHLSDEQFYQYLTDNEEEIDCWLLDLLLTFREIGD